MKATLQSKNETSRYQFSLEFDGKIYDVVIYLKRGKFIDEEISFEGDELDGEGNEGEIRERIINYLSENWDKLA